MTNVFLSDILDKEGEVKKMYRVKKRREELGMTQQDLAKKAQVSRQTIVSIESNENFQTSTATLVKIARALNCKVSSIFLA